MTQGELNECAGKDLQKADAELKRVYVALLQQLKADPVGVETLRESERAWVKFRDAQMKALHPHSDQEGSVGPMCWSSQMADLTVQRIKMLKDMLNTQEGDVCAYK